VKTAELNHVPAFSFRVITDRAEEIRQKELSANWEQALRDLYPVIKAFVFQGWLIDFVRVLSPASR
jgi:hypothetical protein